MTDKEEILQRIEELITAVYRDRTINPWETSKLRVAKFEQLFRDRLPDWPLRNQTDPVFGGSTAIAFLLHPGHYIGVPTRDGIETRIRRLGGACYQSLVEISHLGPFARIRFTKETVDNATGMLGYEEQDEPYRIEDNSFYKALMTILEDEGIAILPHDLLDRPVSDLELDVTEAGCVTVYHCLFDEE